MVISFTKVIHSMLSLLMAHLVCSFQKSSSQVFVNLLIKLGFLNRNQVL